MPKSEDHNDILIIPIPQLSSERSSTRLGCGEQAGWITTSVESSSITQPPSEHRQTASVDTASSTMRWRSIHAIEPSALSGRGPLPCLVLPCRAVCASISSSILSSSSLIISNMWSSFPSSYVRNTASGASTYMQKPKMDTDLTGFLSLLFSTLRYVGSVRRMHIALSRTHGDVCFFLSSHVTPPPVARHFFFHVNCGISHVPALVRVPAYVIYYCKSCSLARLASNRCSTGFCGCVIRKTPTEMEMLLWQPRTTRRRNGTTTV